MFSKHFVQSAADLCAKIDLFAQIQYKQNDEGGQGRTETATESKQKQSI